MSAVGSAKGSNGNSKDLLERVGLFTAEEENGAMLEKRKSFRLQNGEKFAERIDGRVIAAIVLWYFWSGCTLFLNKYLIDLTDGDAAILSKTLEKKSRVFLNDFLTPKKRLFSTFGLDLPGLCATNPLFGNVQSGTDTKQHSNPV